MEIKASNYTSSEKLYSVLELLSQSHKFCSNHKSLQEMIKNTMGHAYSLIDELYDKENERIQTWNKLLKKYYKMTLRKEEKYHTYVDIKYIYPYQVITENSTLWVLEVNPDDNYNGGVKDKSYTLDESWNYDTTLEEISKEEFFNQAIKSTEHVINRRLNREIEKLKENADR